MKIWIILLTLLALTASDPTEATAQQPSHDEGHLIQQQTLDQVSKVG